MAARARRWKKLLVAGVTLALTLAVVGLPYALAVLITRAGTRPMDRSLTSSPGDYGVDYEEVEFPAGDGTRIRGWYLGGGDRNLAVALGHGLFRSRREVLDRAVFFRRLGLDTLVFDFRRHGESGGVRTTLGYQERHDFHGAVRFVEKRSPADRILVYGVSMGAAAALLAARETEAIDAVIADSPFLSIEHTVVHHVDLVLGLPRFPFASLLLFFLERRGGFDRKDFDLGSAVAAVDEPVLVIAGERDERMPPELQRRLVELSPSPRSEFVEIPGAGHGAAYRTEPEDYEAAVRSFLRKSGLLE